jgi:hypothetical protein
LACSSGVVLGLLFGLYGPLLLTPGTAWPCSEPDHRARGLSHVAAHPGSCWACETPDSCSAKRTEPEQRRKPRIRACSDRSLPLQPPGSESLPQAVTGKKHVHSLGVCHLLELMTPGTGLKPRDRGQSFHGCHGYPRPMLGSPESRATILPGTVLPCVPLLQGGWPA